MKILSLLAIAAVLVATDASAQGVSDHGSKQTQDSASADRFDTKHSTKAKERIARHHGSSSFASAPDARSSAARTRAAATAFDGDWSVLIQTQVGNCERAYRYGVQIQNGEVLNGGGESVALEGHVARNGAVRVNVAAGGQEAYGVGRLSRTSGGGTWRGQGSAGTCAGNWVAERRE